MKVILVEPTIPPNTGSIGRLCAATGVELVLVEPLGFSLDDRYLKRAGLDYWPWIDLTVEKTWQDALSKVQRPWLFTSHAKRLYTDVVYRDTDALVFGSEVSGLPKELLAKYAEQNLKIPMSNPNIRSINLAQAAAVGLYEAIRQVGLSGNEGI